MGCSARGNWSSGAGAPAVGAAREQRRPAASSAARGPARRTALACGQNWERCARVQPPRLTPMLGVQLLLVACKPLLQVRRLASGHLRPASVPQGCGSHTGRGSGRGHGGKRTAAGLSCPRAPSARLRMVTLLPALETTSQRASRAALHYAMKRMSTRPGPLAVFACTLSLEKRRFKDDFYGVSWVGSTWMPCSGCHGGRVLSGQLRRARSACTLKPALLLLNAYSPSGLRRR